jgi:DNA mismatch endonuclease (patch repair protein)
MSKIRGKETKPEILVRKYLFSKGFRYRLHDEKLPGKPDIVLPKYRTAIFIHGCFWHGHLGCKRAKLPTTNTEFWEKKISANIERDKRNIEKLKSEVGMSLSYGSVKSQAQKKERYGWSG